MKVVSRAVDAKRERAACRGDAYVPPSNPLPGLPEFPAIRAPHHFEGLDYTSTVTGSTIGRRRVLS